MNKKGPKTDPCGTPRTIDPSSDSISDILKIFVLSCRKILNILRAPASTPADTNNEVPSTKKALLSKAVRISRVTCSSAVLHL